MNDKLTKMYKIFNTVDTNERDILFKKIMKECNLMVWKIIHNIKHTDKIEDEDLYQEAMISIFNIFENRKYDENKKANISTFICTVVKNDLINYVKNNQFLIKVPQFKQKTFSKIYNFENEFIEREHKCPLEKDYILNGFNKKDIDTYKQISMQNNMYDIDDFKNVITDDFKDFCNNNESILQDIETLLKGLSNKEKEYIYNFIRSDFNMSLMAKEMHCSRQNISQNLSRIFKKIRKNNNFT